MSTRAGRAILKRRRAKGRKRLSVPEGRPPTGRVHVQRRNRLSRSRDFDAVYRQGRSVSTRFLVLYQFDREEIRTARLGSGSAVPKKIGGAVVRNRVKRPAARGLARAARPSAPGTTTCFARPALARGGGGSRQRLAARAGGGGSREGGRVRYVGIGGLRVPVHPSACSPRPPASTTRPARSTRSRPSGATGSSRLGAGRLAAPALQPVEPRRGRPRRRPEAVPMMLSILTPLEDVLTWALEWTCTPARAPGRGR